MKLQFQFMRRHNIIEYHVVSSLFMAGNALISAHTSKQEADVVCKRYNSKPHDSYEDIYVEAKKVEGYLDFKKL